MASSTIAQSNADRHIDPNANRHTNANTDLNSDQHSNPDPDQHGDARLSNSNANDLSAIVDSYFFVTSDSTQIPL